MKRQVRLLPVFSRREHWCYRILVIFWLGVNFYFWRWWLRQEHVGSPILYTLMSIALFYETTLLPSFYTFYLGQMRRPKHIPIIRSLESGTVRKVAMITLTVPGSESLEIVKRQLEAMRRVAFPHDSWILVDKCHSPEIKALAESLGVKYFSRHDEATWGKGRVKRWNRPIPPFKAKTKAGNVNAWLNAFGREYSHFTQLDIDHVPHPQYLNRVLGYFLDENVAWVQAPSIYGNMDDWTARGSTEQEFVLQGPLQMGFFGFCRTPFIIGSHCTYDMAAVLGIGGFQPTRAEDHLDTVCLAAKGKRGVFVPEVLAVGDGPENFETYLAQQFAWAYSMIQVMIHYTPKCLKKYTPRQALQFLFVQSWYTLWSISMLLLFSLPLVGLVSNQPISNVGFWDFLVHSLALTATALVIWFWSRKWHQPKGFGISWRGIVLHIARWPVVLSALIQVVLKVEKPYMITVKGIQRGNLRPFSLKPHLPYLLLTGISLVACWINLFTYGRSPTQGYLLFALQGAIAVTAVGVIALLNDIAGMIKEGVSVAKSMRLRIKPIVVLLLLICSIAFTSGASITRINEALTYKEEARVASDSHPLDDNLIVGKLLAFPWFGKAR